MIVRKDGTPIKSDDTPKKKLKKKKLANGNVQMPDGRTVIPWNGSISPKNKRK